MKKTMKKSVAKKIKKVTPKGKMSKKNLAIKGLV